jgi:hypothetical protein
MDGIVVTLNKMSFAQMVLAWAFVGCYALALGGMLGATSSFKAGLAAACAAAAFCMLSDQWVHGALLVIFAVAGMGLFVALAWLLARSATWWLQRHEPRAQPAVVAPVVANAHTWDTLRALWRSLA